MGDYNPFEDDGGKSPLLTPGQRPQVPISAPNPFDEGAPPLSYPHPSTFTGNVADTLNAASNTFSMGMTDRLRGAQAAAMGWAPSYSAGVNQAVADTAMRRERSPYLSLAGDVGGGVAQAYVPGVGAVGRNLSAAMGGAKPGLAGVAARTLGYGVEGGVLGAGQAAGHTYTGDPYDYARNAIVGGALGGVLGAPFGKFADVAPKSLAAVPSSADLKTSASGHYTSTHAIPIDYSAPKFWNGVDALEQNLYATTNQVKSPTVWEVLRLAREGRNQAPAGSNPTVSPKNIDELRQQLTGVKEPGAYQARQWLDQFMQTPGHIVRGGPTEMAAVQKALAFARGDYRAGKRTQSIEEANQYAEDRFNTANSAQNAGNTYRQKLVALLNPKSSEGRWFSPEEKADIRNVTRGEAVANALRTTGNYSRGITGQAAGGGGIAAALATGDLTPLLALGVPAVGSALKGIGNRMTVRHAQELPDVMAKRSPMYRERVANAPWVAGPGLGNFAEGSRNTITNELLNQGRIRGIMPSIDEE